MPNDVQVIFVLGLGSRQNESAFVHLAALQHTPYLEIIFMVRCGSKNHDLFVAERLHRIDFGRAERRHITRCQQHHGQNRGDTGYQKRDVDLVLEDLV